MAHPETQFYNGRGRIHCLLLLVVFVALAIVLGLIVLIVWLIVRFCPIGWA